MKKYQKILICALLLFFIFGFINIKTAKAISIEDKARIIEEIKAQLVIIIDKITEIQRQLNELIESEETGTIKSITLISPNGEEKWETGKTYDIKWNSSGYPSDSKVQIKLLDERYSQILEQSELNIIETANSGLYNWKIPDALNGHPLYGSLYKIAVYIGEGNEKKSDESDSYFIVSAAVPFYLNMVSPNGGEILKVGEIYTIKWDSLGTENYKASIVLTKSDRVHLTIAEKVPNNSFYNWEISQGLYGSDYKILINIYGSSGNLVVWDSSNYNFTITQ